MNKHSKISPRKSIGQHFLHDKNIASKIVDLLSPPEGSCVIEIGPGTGILTDLLLQKNLTLIAFEIDSRSVEVLKEKHTQLMNRNFFINEQDFLKSDLKSLAEKYGKKLLIIGNIPYYITSPILFHLFEYSEYIDRCVLMTQKEILQRLKANPRTKDYGILTLGLQLYGKAGKGHDVPPSCFVPHPNVMSSFFGIDFFPESEKPVPQSDCKQLHSLIRSAFGQRRKKLSNSLKSILQTRLNPEISLPVNIGDYLSKRPEELSLNDFVILYNYLFQKI